MRIACDVVFGEGRGWAWDKAVDDGSTSTNSDFVVEYAHFEEAELSVTKHVYPSSGIATSSGESSADTAGHAPFAYAGAPYTYSDVHASKLNTASLGLQRASPGGVRHAALQRRGPRRRVPRR